ncbi:uncharacterized protein LOC123558176 [Mercenaria mercenaria]|uniref:uncharacterized protein LOC123558176 n=1 Tax=Mercenaria mercenaria TaxID=6596 RepID=UPI00234ED2F7|nr:uncharacterized protein LOC123558176 [Mercenaria mercenaria]
MPKPTDKIRSLQISNALDTESFGLSQREETKRTQLIGQYLEEYFWKNKSITSGGRAEGTALDKNSDSDVMGVIGGILVVENDHDMDENVIYISAVRTGCCPGYCKLKFQADQYSKFMSGQYTPKEVSTIYEGIKRSIITLSDQYISSELFCKNVIPDGLIPGDNFHDILYELNGPATRNADVDFVQAFEMRQWPKEAKAWITRCRKNKWPCKALLKRLEENIPCYVVAIGNKSSADKDMEWRLSFVEIERELIWSMNETQFKCFVILKRLTQFFGRYSALKDITTYHMKNIMFWMCETEKVPQEEWIPQNLITCVKRCLRKLKKCMKDGKLDHFIIPENNLFQNKTFVSKEIDHAINKLQRNELYELISEIRNSGKELSTLLLISPEFMGYSNTCKSMWRYCCDHYDPDFCRFILDKFPEARILLPCVQIAQAKAKWRKKLIKMAWRKEPLCSGTRNLAKRVVKNIKEGSEMDFSTSTIYAAIVHFMHGNYDDVLTELKPLLSNKEWKIYPSSLGTPMYLCFKSGEMHIKRKETVRNVEDLHRDRNNLVNDLCTGNSDRDMYINGAYVRTLPYPLALQLVLNTWRAVYRCNPVIISYYLMCMSQLKLGHLEAMKETMCHFKNAVQYNKGRRDYHLSLVLLGHCLYWSGDIETAFECFAESMMVKKSVLNVAVYHMAFLINDWTRCNI